MGPRAGHLAYDTGSFPHNRVDHSTVLNELTNYLRGAFPLSKILDN